MLHPPRIRPGLKARVPKVIEAITFDLWDTVIRDDSDEPKRAAMGLASKREARRLIAWEALAESNAIERANLDLAYEVMEAAFNHVWHEQHITWTVEERVEVLCRGLRADIPEANRRRLVQSLEEMEVTVPPDPVDGIAEAIEALAGRYRIGVVSDAIYTPGRCLRRWLAMHGLDCFFAGFAFSDEVGHSKPHRAMFASAADQLGVRFDAMLHIGDREHNDVRGPHGLGMKAVLFTASRDKDKSDTTADAVCESARDLPAVIERLATR